MEAIAQQIVDSICEFSSLQQAKKHLSLLLKSTPRDPHSSEFSSNSLFSLSLQQSSLISLFSQKLLSTLQTFFPKLFPLSSQPPKFSRQLQQSPILFPKIVALFRTHKQLSQQLQTTKTITKRPTKKPPKRKHFDQLLGSSHVFVRLLPKSQQTMQYMLENKHFPRLQLKISTSHHLQQLVEYLEEKWVERRSKKILLFPDCEQYLRKVRNRQEEGCEPLNKYFMMTDILSAYDWPKNNVVNLYYEITEEAADTQKHSKHSKPSKLPHKKQKQLLSIQQQKLNPHPMKQPLNLNPKPPCSQNSNAFLNNPHSLNFESLGCSFFRKPNPNSNSFWDSLGMPFGRLEDSNHLDVLRETIRLVEEEAKPEEGFRVPEERGVFAVPVIKRKKMVEKTAEGDGQGS